MYLVEFNARHVVPNTALKRRFLALQTAPVMEVTDLHVQYQPLQDEDDEGEQDTDHPAPVRYLHSFLPSTIHVLCDEYAYRIPNPYTTLCTPR